MKLLADHCFFQEGVELLKKAGYDCLRAKDAGLQQATNEEIALFCQKENRIILTLDTDFGSLYRFPLGTHKGIVLFRLNPFTPGSLVNILQILVERKMFGLFESALAIVRKDKIKIIRPSGVTETI